MVASARGIDEAGDKHVLGMYEGATENSTACKGLLSDLERRGMRTDRSVLVVLDGSKPLLSAVRGAVFGARAVVQRCQVHKRRNVEDQRHVMVLQPRSLNRILFMGGRVDPVLKFCASR